MSADDPIDMITTVLARVTVHFVIVPPITIWVLNGLADTALPYTWRTVLAVGVLWGLVRHYVRDLKKGD
jgi:hypothetical protein